LAADLLQDRNVLEQSSCRASGRRLGREADGRLQHPDEDGAEGGAPNARCFPP